VSNARGPGVVTRAAQNMGMGMGMEETKVTCPEHSTPHYLRQFFAYEHLPAHLQKVSAPFGELARFIDEQLPSNPEATTALRKLLEAKDCAVRALLFK
jgi:hypothetical protein